jgi:predicted ATP-dependent serine protease
MKFGSNVLPAKFGRGAQSRQDWICVCGAENKKWLVRCDMCNLERDKASEANATEVK